MDEKERKELEAIRDGGRIMGPLDLTPLFAKFILEMDALPDRIIEEMEKKGTIKKLAEAIKDAQNKDTPG